MMRKKQSEFAQHVARELERARAMHKGMTSAHEAYAVILEELEEFKLEVFKKKSSDERLLSELIQTAAMCQRAAEDIGLIVMEEKPKHVCGLSGFGVGTDGLWDTCPACEAAAVKREGVRNARTTK